MDATRWLFHQITVKDYAYTPESGGRPFEADEASDASWLARMQGHVSFAGKSVLDVGCGGGTMCARAAREGARRVVGIDLDVDGTADRVLARYPEIADRVEFVATDGDLDELREEQFDLVLSKDSMEHFPDPEAFVHLMTERVLCGGELAIGFSPLWKSPKGGHIDYMTKVPWAHLIFPERTIMAERRRFRPHEEASSFAEIVGGLNKMTLARFHRIMASTRFESVYLETNVGDRRALKAFRMLAKVPALREYFTVGVYSVWRRPEEAL